MNRIPSKLRKSKSDGRFTLVPFKKLPNTKAWKMTSDHVRKLSKGYCYTCRNRYPQAKLSAGHFIEKIGGAATYFNLDNLRAQCYYCNRKRHGNKEIYALNLIKEIGLEKVKELRKIAQKPKVWTKLELDEIATELKALRAGTQN